VLELTRWEWGLVKIGAAHNANYGRQPSPGDKDKPVAGLLPKAKHATRATGMAFCGPNTGLCHCRHSKAPHRLTGMALTESMTMPALMASPWPGRLAAQQDLTPFALLAPVAPVAQVAQERAVASAPLGFAPEKTGSGLKNRGLEGELALRASRQFEATRSEPRLLVFRPSKRRGQFPMQFA